MRGAFTGILSAAALALLLAASPAKADDGDGLIIQPAGHELVLPVAASEPLEDRVAPADDEGNAAPTLWLPKKKRIRVMPYIGAGVGGVLHPSYGGDMERYTQEAIDYYKSMPGVADQLTFDTIVPMINLGVMLDLGLIPEQYGKLKLFGEFDFASSFGKKTIDSRVHDSNIEILEGSFLPIGDVAFDWTQELIFSGNLTLGAMYYVPELKAGCFDWAPGIGAGVGPSYHNSHTSIDMQMLNEDTLAMFPPLRAFEIYSNESIDVNTEGWGVAFDARLQLDFRIYDFHIILDGAYRVNRVWVNVHERHGFDEGVLATDADPGGKVETRDLSKVLKKDMWRAMLMLGYEF
ncbi:hypothetical protein HN698_00115 [Candidatus Woesearchaeota archaeon]|jgi:hypothetical protein|nr:hypothetical protein [Candidatus Woesearchaeota archaeon]MBT4698166.1 hypothetical protein [Candidatus Woesearchaeota archaeon]MBT4716353.1 hypothetical protein [Candidatus Woesearchaeota archaeon]MBT7930305.1 hypothetical protein [Candidatus Woesearchaeota archaeon]